ncbi:MAG: hypothetical protein WAW03_05850 [Anaerolineae bacterium]|uniref:hypothetical protein n=1 Tax=Candidatus Amarolinea dominans TaxID=3140696 RepID=UPI001D5C974E|nr:hypothetical protein [Anaerolineae bacterium]
MSAKSLRLDPVGLGFITLTSTLVIQLFHNVEHVIQMFQKYAWHLNRFPGLLGLRFDFELVHFLYSLALWVALLATIILYRRNPGIWRESQAAALALQFALWFQGYHVLEHSVRIWQYFGLGMLSPTPGILGNFFPILELHFWFNSIVTTALIIAYIGFRPWWRTGKTPYLNPQISS